MKSFSFCKKKVDDTCEKTPLMTPKKRFQITNKGHSGLVWQLVARDIKRLEKSILKRN